MGFVLPSIHFFLPVSFYLGDAFVLPGVNDDLS